MYALRLAKRIDPSSVMIPFVPLHLTMVIHIASNIGLQARIGANLTRTAREWNNYLYANLTNISSSVSPSRVSLSVIDARAMKITSTQDDADHASAHGRLDISNALPPNTLPLSTLLTTRPGPHRPGSQKGWVSTLGRLRDCKLV